VLVLALDTATPAVTAGVVELTADGCIQRSVRVVHDARKHAELLMPGIVAACDEAGVALGDLAAVVTGVGPGPFTGLRVGMVTGAALGDALGIPVHGVCSLDAIAHGLGAVLVVTDARRREVYWSRYADGVRTHGPEVVAPAELAARLGPDGDLGPVDRVVGDAAEKVGAPADAPGPRPDGLVAVAAPALRAGTVPGPLVPLYLRRPDAVPPGAPKTVTRA